MMSHRAIGAVAAVVLVCGACTRSTAPDAGAALQGNLEGTASGYHLTGTELDEARAQVAKLGIGQPCDAGACPGELRCLGYNFGGLSNYNCQLPCASEWCGETPPDSGCPRPLRCTVISPGMATGHVIACRYPGMPLDE